LRELPCPECGSDSVEWRYDRGEVVCGSCGLVLGPVYHLDRLDSDDRQPRCPYSKYARFVRAKERSFELFAELRKRAGGRGDLYVDAVAFQRYLSTRDRGGVRLLASVRSKKALELLGRNAELEEVVERIVMKEPLLASRTVRGKAAAAYVIWSLSKGRVPRAREVSEKTGVSLTQARRIIRLVQATCSKKEPKASPAHAFR